LEHPREVVESCAPHTATLHVKDFGFTRREGWVGFTYSGTPLGEGLLDLDHELATVYPEGRTPSAIVEHWLPWQGGIGATLAAERRGTGRSRAPLRTWREGHAPRPPPLRRPPTRSRGTGPARPSPPDHPSEHLPSLSRRVTMTSSKELNPLYGKTVE